MKEMTSEERKEINGRFDSLEKQINRILGILENDESIGEDGLVSKVRSIKKALKELLVREQVYKAKATVWGILGGAIGTVALWIGKVLLSKIFMI